MSSDSEASVASGGVLRGPKPDQRYIGGEAEVKKISFGYVSVRGHPFTPAVQVPRNCETERGGASPFSIQSASSASKGITKWSRAHNPLDYRHHYRTSRQGSESAENESRVALLNEGYS